MLIMLKTAAGIFFQVKTWNPVQRNKVSKDIQVFHEFIKYTSKVQLNGALEFVRDITRYHGKQDK